MGGGKFVFQRSGPGFAGVNFQSRCFVLKRHMVRKCTLTCWFFRFLCSPFWFITHEKKAFHRRELIACKCICEHSDWIDTSPFGSQDKPTHVIVSHEHKNADVQDKKRNLFILNQQTCTNLRKSSEASFVERRDSGVYAKHAWGHTPARLWVGSHDAWLRLRAQSCSLSNRQDFVQPVWWWGSKTQKETHFTGFAHTTTIQLKISGLASWSHQHGKWKS